MHLAIVHHNSEESLAYSHKPVLHQAFPLCCFWPLPSPHCRYTTSCCLFYTLLPWLVELPFYYPPRSAPTSAVDTHSAVSLAFSVVCREQRRYSTTGLMPVLLL